MQTLQSGHLVNVEVSEDKMLSLMERDHFGVMQWRSFDRQKWPEILPEEVQEDLDHGSFGDCECQAIIWGYLDGIWYHVWHACGANAVWVGGLILPYGGYQEVEEFIWPEKLEAVEL